MKTNVSQTSIDAHRTKIVPHLNKLQFRILIEFHRDRKPMTYKDVMTKTGLSQSCVSGRINELKALGKLKITGRYKGCNVYELRCEDEPKEEMKQNKKDMRIAELENEVQRLSDLLTERNRTIQNMKGENLSLRQIYKERDKDNAEVSEVICPCNIANCSYKIVRFGGLTNLCLKR